MWYQRNKHHSLLLSQFPETQHFLPESIPRKENNSTRSNSITVLMLQIEFLPKEIARLAHFWRIEIKLERNKKDCDRRRSASLVQNTHLTNADRFGICLTSCDTSSSFDRTTQMPLLLPATLCGLIPNKSCFVCALWLSEGGGGISFP